MRRYIENEIHSLENDENIQNQKNLAISMDQLNNDDFPLFLTIKRLIYMIDASTEFPFFARDNQGK